MKKKKKKVIRKKKKKRRENSIASCSTISLKPFSFSQLLNLLISTFLGENGQWNYDTLILPTFTTNCYTERTSK